MKINYDPVITTRSAQVANAVAVNVIEGKKLPGNGQVDRMFMILKIDPRGSSVPALGLYTCMMYMTIIVND